MNASHVPCLGGSFRVVETTAASLSLLLNTLLCTIILLNRSKELRAYSRVLLCNAFVDTFFTLSSFIVEIHPDVRGGIFFVVNDGLDIRNYDINLYLFCLYLFSVYFAIAIVAVPMVCRYLAVCSLTETSPEVVFP
ncbi:hypothetical protein AAVH_16791 [Aphelenchoides avenae]|nr:hypothetical protein AAVH_16791 [Aphelenchus avenae]